MKKIKGRKKTKRRNKNASTMEDNRWSGLLDEIAKLFNASLLDSFRDLGERALICASKEDKHGDYICENVLTIWPQLRNNPEVKKYYSTIKVPKDVGEGST